jgi:amidase
VSIGTETNGSIVCPAASTGVVGMKPTLGLVSRDGIVPISAEQDTAGPLARHAVDAVTGGVSAAVEEIEAAGANPVPVQLGYRTEVPGSLPALLAEFRRDLNAYLAATPADHPADLAGLIEFNAQDPVELGYFGQELFEQAQAAAVPADDPAVRALRDEVRRLARASIDEALVQGPGPEDDLDAVVALTNTPSRLTGYANLGADTNTFVYGSSGTAAVAGYPNVTVPAGFAGPQEALPIGISFSSTRWDDADVLGLAASFEAAVDARRAPGYLPTVGG